MKTQEVQKGIVMKSPLGKSIRKFVLLSFIASIGVGAFIFSSSNSFFEERKRKRELSNEKSAAEKFASFQEEGKLDHLKYVVENAYEENTRKGGTPS